MLIHCSKMAEMAGIAYLDKSPGKAKYKKLGYPGHSFIENDGAQCHVVWNDEEIVLCFRGTEPNEFSDILADLNAWPDKAQVGGRVHNGFQNELEKIWDKIVELIEMDKDKELYITGHSLGGAMATIAASRLKDEVEALYTYGSPRVGTRKFVKSFSNVEHYRHVNNNDIVTSIPLALMGYVHHCPPRYINYHGNIRPFTPTQRLKDKWRGRWRAIKKGMPFDGAYDHGMNHYCKYTKEN